MKKSLRCYPAQRGIGLNDEKRLRPNGRSRKSGLFRRFGQDSRVLDVGVCAATRAQGVRAASPSRQAPERRAAPTRLLELEPCGRNVVAFRLT